MVTCDIILHGDLPDLCGGRQEVVRRLPAPTSVKDALEALGIPHCEVGRVTVDGHPGNLACPLRDGERLDAWPARPHDLADPRFVCDLHLGKLARRLRFCGFDTLWEPSWREPVIARVAVREGRTVLSRHRALLKRSCITTALLIRNDRADDQLAEVIRRFKLAGRIARCGRCPHCNGRLVPTPKNRVPVAIPPKTAAWRDDYWVCAECGRLFWEGTHVLRLRDRLAHIAHANDGFAAGPPPRR
jgi:hypothetical protein